MWKVIFYIAICVLFSVVSGYMGYSLKVALEFDVVKDYPAIVVGLGAAAAALLGVFISQLGQYLVAKLTLKNNQEKEEKNLQKEFSIELHQLRRRLKWLVNCQRNVECATCNYFYIYLDIDDGISKNKSDVDFKLFDVAIEERNIANENVKTAADDYYQSLAFIKYYCLRNPELIKPYEDYANFQDTISDKLNDLSIMMTTISSAYNETLGGYIPADFIEKYPTPYKLIIEKSNNIIDYIDQEIDDIYNKIFEKSI